jgi:hypothetical protein
MTPTTEVPKLSRIEWQAVSIGLQDAAKCGCGDLPKPGSLRRGISRLSRMLTGIEGPRPFADPRLEAVRNFVCATHRHRRRADEYAAALLEQGFNRAQIDAFALLSA